MTTEITTDELQAHEQEMAVQRERFQRFWDCIEQSLPAMSDHEKFRIQHEAWNRWRTGQGE